MLILGFARVQSSYSIIYSKKKCISWLKVSINLTGKKHLSVKQFMEGINSSDSNTEANLYTILQSIRGTEQFWYQKKSDVMAMVREYGSPTFFLTLSFAKYDSVDIDPYLRKVSNVSESYPISKLCAKDPVSVSRKFSQRFFQFCTLERSNSRKHSTFLKKKISQEVHLITTYYSRLKVPQ